MLVNDKGWLKNPACSNQECVMVYTLQRHVYPDSDEKRIKKHEILQLQAVLDLEMTYNTHTQIYTHTPLWSCLPHPTMKENTLTAMEAMKKNEELLEILWAQKKAKTRNGKNLGKQIWRSIFKYG